MIARICICQECYNEAVDNLGSEIAHYYTVLCRRFAEYGPIPISFSQKGKKMVTALEKGGYITTLEVETSGKFLKLKPNGCSFDEDSMILCPNCSKV